MGDFDGFAAEHITEFYSITCDDTCCQKAEVTIFDEEATCNLKLPNLQWDMQSVLSMVRLWYHKYHELSSPKPCNKMIAFMEPHDFEPNPKRDDTFVKPDELSHCDIR